MLPQSVQEIADVIGREAALHLIRNSRKYRGGRDGGKCAKVILSVPKRLKPNHRLVEILGLERASQMVEAFGGETKHPANCNWLHLLERNDEIRRMASEGVANAELAKAFNLTERRIRDLVRATPKSLLTPAND